MSDILIIISMEVKTNRKLFQICSTLFTITFDDDHVKYISMPFMIVIFDAVSIRPMTSRLIPNLTLRAMFRQDSRERQNDTLGETMYSRNF